MPFGKWENFEACVLDFVNKGKDEESAKRICGALQARLGAEALNWTGNVEAAEQQGDYKYYIKGKAIHPVKTVHPNEWPQIRVYLEEELAKAAHTLAGSPLILDHLQPIDGKVLAAEYEDGAVEYFAGHNDSQIDRWIRDGVIKHCSVEYDWETLSKVNGVAPKDITFKGLALLKDFSPGDPATTVEVWESLVKKLKEQEDSEREKINGLKSQVESLTRQVEALKAEKIELTKKLGEAVIEPSATPKIKIPELITELKTIAFQRIPIRWGQAAYERNRRLQRLIQKLEKEA